ncbi:M48 family metalloprotease [Agaribacterium haliotis]|uniref:M48 family metalloprotease n=1 Tax=Agaribacterium haliotis TaxID=2013869 RepID=UPI001EFE78FA|nr:M48 family metalloprotease [Agaribacterium haliotis]
MFRLITITSLLLALQACAVNPVTGKSELSLVSAQQEVSIGEQHYLASQQQQGGVYTVDPELNLYVQGVGKKLAAVSDRKELPYEFVVLNSDVPNAWALPGGKIAINRGLLIQLDDEAQLAAVMGHEIVHAAARHGAQKMTQQQVLGAGAAAVGIAAASSDSDYAGLIAAGAMGGAQLYQAHYGRSQELESDKYGMKYMAKAGYEPQAAVELQQTFVKLSQGQKSDMFSSLLASHPPSEERVAKNKQMAKTLPKGQRYRDRYQRATAQIRKDQPAYDKNIQAQKAAANKEWAKAEQLVAAAIKMQNKEAMFFNTQGQIYMAQKKNSKAEQSFKQATRLNPDYFANNLGLGMALVEQGKDAPAKAAFEQSVKKLPTQLAYWELGNIEKRANNKSAATKYYQQVAQAGGELGQKAQAELQKLGAN